MKNWLVSILLGLVFLAACNGGGTPSPSPTVPPVSDECLVGIWELTSPESYLRAAMPIGSVDQSALKFLGPDGELAYKFEADGTLLVYAIKLMGRFGLDTEQGRLLLETTIDGFGGGRYRQEGDILRGEWTDSSRRASYLARLDGETMMESQNGADFLPLFVAPYTSARYQCSQETLSLEILNLASVGGPLVFRRAE
ncbi:MAG: hypothetical protein JXA78_11335 [Anaerolineales bacterium]|nr:hypothetical protein [Anaerolineales bacterium]